MKTVDTLNVTGMEPDGKLFSALAKAQLAFGNLPKRHTANVGKYTYKYADLTDVIKSVRVPLANNGLAFMQKPTAIGDTVSVSTMLVHEEGGVVEFTTSISGFEGGPQQLGSVFTYLKRYALCAVLGISADEDLDAADTNNKTQPHQDGTRKTPAKSKSNATDDAKKELAEVIVKFINAPLNRQQLASACKHALRTMGFKDTTTKVNEINATTEACKTAMGEGVSWKEFIQPQTQETA